MAIENLNEKTDEELIESVKLGSKPSFEVLYGKYKDNIFNYLYHFIGNRECAEDCTQDVFIQLYRKAGLYSPSSKFSSWLYKMAKNMALDALRKMKIRKTVSLDEPITAGENEAVLGDILKSGSKDPRSLSISAELENGVRTGIAKLQENDREVLVLCDIQQLPQKEVGDILGYSAETIAVKLHRARQKLAEILKIESGPEKS